MTEEFEKKLPDFLDKLGIELPKQHGTEEEKKIYQSFLNDYGLSEEEVDPIINNEKIPAEAHGLLLSSFIQALKNDNKKLLTQIIDMMSTIILKTNTNQLIGRIVYKLLADLDNQKNKIPNFFAGVFPTNSINAQCNIHQNLPLVLIDTGCIEMVGAAMTTFVSKRNETEKAEVLIQILEEYFVEGNCPNIEVANHHSIDWGSQVISAFSNSIEEFIIMHEIGHISLGHISNEATQALPGKNGQEIIVQRKDHFQEYQADIWALLKLVERARENQDSEFALDMSCSGVLIFLCIGLMIEAIAESRGIQINDSHPPIENRLYVAEVTLEVLGVGKHQGYARTFKRLVREICVLEEVSNKMPPMLDRELNQIAVVTYQSLGISYEHMPSIYGLA